jgi:UDP-N-acetylmuramoyl-tripeptide--D-alanyl-D-alanine ligase
VANLFKIEPEKAIEALNNYQPAKFRMEAIKIGGVNLINDSYNANPTSMQSALESLMQIKSEGKKIAVLGDMLELGEQSDVFHQEVGQKAAGLGVNLLITVGELAKDIAAGAIQSGLPKDKVFNFSDNNLALQFLLENLKEGDWVLIKGSRKMKMEEIVSGVQNLYSNQS